MILLIDGYNLLRHAFYKIKGKLIEQREQFIKQLGYYKAKKGIPEIIVVFDGGLLNHAQREVCSGVVVIYSGQKSSADDWILEFVEKNKEKEILLVTLDKKLRDECAVYGVDTISVKDFYDILQNTLLEDLGKNIEKKIEKSAQKFEKTEGFFSDYEYDEYKKRLNQDNQALDLLIDQASLDFIKKDDDNTVVGSRRSKSRVVAKKEKSLYKKIKKL